MELNLIYPNINLVYSISYTKSIDVSEIDSYVFNDPTYEIFYTHSNTEYAVAFAYSSITAFNGSTVPSAENLNSIIQGFINGTYTFVPTDTSAVTIRDDDTTTQATVAAGDTIVGTDTSLAVSDPNVVANLSAIAGILGGTQKTKIIDNSGNVIAATQDEAGNYHLGVAIVQEVVEDAHNSSTLNVNAGNTFTGASSSTVGVAGIQVNLKTDQNCTVYVDQSPDGTNWDITDSFNYYTSKGNFGITVQATSAYLRVRVTNISSVNTTYFRLITMLCPTIEALPRALSSRGNLKTKVMAIEDEYGFEVENTPMGEMRVVTPYRLVGTVFSGNTVDSNFWTSTLGTGGTAAVANAQLTLSTGTTANNTTSLQSFRTARYVGASANRLRAVIRVSDGGTANNTRKWGAFDGTDGAYFQLAGTTLSVVTIKGSTPTAVPTGSFNGELGATYSIGTNVTTYEIYWTNSKVYFVIGGVLLHTVSASTTTWANTLHLPTRVENNNSGGSTTNISIEIRVLTISRLGQAQTQPIHKYQSGTTAGVICKYGPGTLHGAIISGVVNNSVITIYDGTTTGGTVIWASGTMGANTNPISIDFKAIPFYTGLFFAITGANSNFLISYE